MIPSELKSKLEKSAERKGISMAALIRQFAEDKLAEEKKKKNNSVQALKIAVKMAKRGINDKINSENFRQFYQETKGLK